MSATAAVSTRAGLGSASAEEAAYTLDGGYALEPNSDGTGGWLAHRASFDLPSSGPGDDWLPRDMIEAARDFRPAGAKLAHAPRVLVLYGSLRESSFSRRQIPERQTRSQASVWPWRENRALSLLGAFSRNLLGASLSLSLNLLCRRLAHECARLLEAMGADVRVFSPQGLPVRDPSLEDHPKVKELRALSLWSEAHVWVSPEMHGTLTGVFKNQIDWLPLNTGSVRPTQGRTAAVLQVNGGSQSFNAVNELRRLARWMRMPCTTNQSSVAKAWQEFDEAGRMKPGPFRERVVDVMEEHIKFTRLMREHADFLVDRYSERKEIADKGKLLTQAEKEGAELIESKKP